MWTIEFRVYSKSFHQLILYCIVLFDRYCYMVYIFYICFILLLINYDCFILIIIINYHTHSILLSLTIDKHTNIDN